MAKTKNVVFRCDKCQDDDKNIFSMLEGLMNELKKMDKNNAERYEQVINRVENIETHMNVSGKKVVDEIVKVVEETKSENAGSWAEVVSKTKKKKAKDPVVILVPKDKEQKREATKSMLKKAKLDPNDYAVRGISNAGNNGVIIRCSNDEDCEKLVLKAKEALGNDYVVHKPRNRLPRFKILKVDDPEIDDEKFLNDLMYHNEWMENAKKYEIVKREQVKSRGKEVDNCYNIVIQTDGESFDLVMKNRKLLVRWESYKVVDNFYIRRCYKCYGFNHEAATCSYPLSCSRCSGSHLIKGCRSKEERCNNCVQANKRLKLNLNENHSVWSNDCPVYKRKMAISKRAISY
jgi:hypothetical protein